MWYDTLPPGQSWATLWNDRIRCGECWGIRPVSGVCPGCGEPLREPEPLKVRASDGSERSVMSALMGGEGRYEDLIYLSMLEREWLRPLTDDDRFLNISGAKRPSPRAIVVLVFWTYFETRIERLFREALSNLPSAVTEDFLLRYASIGARLDRLYRIAFSSTYHADLKDLGFEHVSRVLERVHRQRNHFAHGAPEAIDDILVTDLVSSLKDEHDSWIAVFNRRAIRKRRLTDA